MTSLLTNCSQPQQIKTLRKLVKAAIAAQGIDPATRKGSKELELLLKKIAKQPLSQGQITAISTKLAGLILEISRKCGKTTLDRGVIRQIAFDKSLNFTVEIAPSELAAVAPNVAKSSQKTPIIEAEKIVESTPKPVVAPQPLLVEEEIIEEAVIDEQSVTVEEEIIEEAVIDEQSVTVEEEIIEETVIETEPILLEEVTDEEPVDSLESPLDEEAAVAIPKPNSEAPLPVKAAQSLSAAN